VPKGRVSDEQWDVIDDIVQYGQSKGVNVTVVEVE
jgi:hypothetical protein